MKNKNSRPIGAHISIAGGVSKAPGRARDVGANAIQIFTKNNTQWRSAPLADKEIAAFHENARTLDVGVFASHTCYLINLASPDETILHKSREAFIDEMDRADALSIPNLVFHPGAHTGAGEEEGLRRIVESLDWACGERPSSKVTLTIETTAGQGTGLGHRFEQIARILGDVKNSDRFGVCVDTCHIFAGGYDIATEQGYADTLREFDRLIGVKRIRLFHVNDSKTPLGSRVDRHEHIGKGKIGLDAFGFLLNDRRFFKTPMILETPKGKDGEEDKLNLGVLRGLMVEV
ncbi:MAG: deoxyribonuclease IV [Nitrospinae bacterium]|nr:deoxyribonuclease IV [Nitrospinota bacterium]